MSSIGSSIAQRPYRAKNFVVLSAAALAFPATSVETAAPTGAPQVVGSVITFPSLATAVATASGCILEGGVAMSTGLALEGTTVAITVGQELRDMGHYVTVYNGPSLVYKLALVQSKNEATGTTEGVGGGAPTVALSNGYKTFYVLIETNLPTGQAGVLTVGVARV